jgi:hypothetical protein
MKNKDALNFFYLFGMVLLAALIMTVLYEIAQSIFWMLNCILWDDQPTTAKWMISFMTGLMLVAGLALGFYRSLVNYDK